MVFINCSFTGNNLNCGVGQPHSCVSEVARSGSYITLGLVEPYFILFYFISADGACLW